MINSLLFLEAFILIGLGLFYISLSRTGWKCLGTRPFLLAPALPAIAFLSPSVWLVYLACILAIPVLAQSQRQIVPLYVLSIFLLPELTTPAALDPVKLNYLTTHTCLGIGAAVAAFLRGNAINRGMAGTDLPFALLFIVLLFIAARDTSATNIMRVSVDLSLLIAVPYWLASRLIRNNLDFEHVFLHLSLAGAVLATILICEALLSWPMYRILYDHFGLQLAQGASVKLRGGLIRSTGSFVEATSAAFCLMLMALTASQYPKAFRSRVFHAALIGLLLIGLLAPQSRGAWLGLTVGLAVAWLYRRAGPSFAFVAFATGVAGLVAAVAMPVLSASSSQLEMRSDTIEYRNELMRRGIEEFLRTPLTGDNRTSLEARMSDLRQGEGIIDYVNTYLWVALHAGFLGLLAFAAALLRRVVSLWRARGSLDRGDGSLASGAVLFAGLVAPIEMLAFTSFGGRPAITLFIFLGLSSALLVGVRSRRIGRRGIDNAFRVMPISSAQGSLGVAEAS